MARTCLTECTLMAAFCHLQKLLRRRTSKCLRARTRSRTPLPAMLDALRHNRKLQRHATAHTHAQRPVYACVSACILPVCVCEFFPTYYRHCTNMQRPLYIAHAANLQTQRFGMERSCELETNYLVQ